LKANPDKALAGTTGIGSNLHVFGVLFQKETETRFQSVPYRGSAPGIQDLVAGQIDMMFRDPSDSLPLVQAGAIKAFAITAGSRLASAPDIPTVDEAGLPGFHVTNWTALWAPARTPKEIIMKLNTAVVDALADPFVRRRIAELGQEVFASDQQTPEALAAFHRSEIASQCS
jgi:tripartite-type tricarboxylate transporter receptor subunit TctC